MLKGKFAINGLPLSPISEREVIDDLFSLIYEELRRLATQVRRRDSGATASSTGLVHEAWVRLRGTPALDCQSVEHFKAIAARAMRQVLIDAARRRHAEKRGGTDAIFVPFDEFHHHGVHADEDLIALDLALHELCKLSPRQAEIVEYHFFGGLTATETAQLLNTSPSTVEREWRAAKAWLGSSLRRRGD